MSNFRVFQIFVVVGNTFGQNFQTIPKQMQLFGVGVATLILPEQVDGPLGVLPLLQIPGRGRGR